MYVLESKNVTFIVTFGWSFHVLTTRENFRVSMNICQQVAYQCSKAGQYCWHFAWNCPPISAVTISLALLFNQEVCHSFPYKMTEVRSVKNLHHRSSTDSTSFETVPQLIWIPSPKLFIVSPCPFVLAGLPLTILSMIFKDKGSPSNFLSFHFNQLMHTSAIM